MAQQQACSNEFDFKKLESEFIKLIPEYAEEIPWAKKELCISFSFKVLYNIGPEARQLALEGNEKCWNLEFPSGENKSLVSIYTYNLDTAPSGTPKFVNNRFELSAEQAILLATQIFCHRILPNLEDGNIPFTPTASELFDKNGLDDLMRDLKLDPADNVKKAEVIMSIIQSCPDAGQYLQYSKAHVAACAAISATRNMRDRSTARMICQETISKYLWIGKEFDMDEFVIYLKYIHGGKPANFKYRLLFTESDDIHRLRIAFLEDAKRRKLAELVARRENVTINSDDELPNMSELNIGSVEEKPSTSRQ